MVSFFFPLTERGDSRVLFGALFLRLVFGQRNAIIERILPMDDHDELNILHEAGALLYIMFKEVEKELGVPQGRTECFGVMLLVSIPGTFIVGLIQL